MKSLQKIIDLIEVGIKENTENSLLSGEIIADGFDNEVDEYRKTLENANTWLAEYQQKLSQNTGISNVKIKYTAQSGYFIEVPRTQASKVPDNFIHKQTLVNAQRYLTGELKEFEEKYFEARDKKAEREYELFLGIREDILGGYKDLKNASDLIASIDFISNFAYVAYENDYIKPKMHDSYTLSIIGGRHPVIEKSTSEFITNDVLMEQHSYIHVITGPNMGGKSTFLRQNALIILMAHIGSFVPAKKAFIPVTDKIFSRVGANDNIFLGQSTFMVEMQEIANILNNSTKRSFVIIDEVGRGTSTYDGMSLAWAILKENHDNIKAKTLFATHYHELIDESKKLAGVKNFSLAVGENDENLVFLRKVVPGGIKKSFGLEVAKIAGIPKHTIDEAKYMLELLENEHNSIFSHQMSLGDISTQKIIYKTKESEIEKQIKNLNLNQLTPILALQILYDLQKKL